MRVLLCVVALICVTACGGSDVAPAPQPANLIVTGTLSVQGCQFFSATGLFSCAQFSGVLQNTGSGCANAVRGTTITQLISSRQQIGSGGWSYGNLIRPGEQAVYVGGPIVVAQSGLWEYVTSPSWTNVNCQ
jgi:hypothetical protein